MDTVQRRNATKGTQAIVPFFADFIGTMMLTIVLTHSQQRKKYYLLLSKLESSWLWYLNLALSLYFVDMLCLNSLVGSLVHYLQNWSSLKIVRTWLTFLSHPSLLRFRHIWIKSDAIKLNLYQPPFLHCRHRLLAPPLSAIKSFPNTRQLF